MNHDGLRIMPRRDDCGPAVHASNSARRVSVASFSFGSFERTFQVPEGIDTDKIRTRFMKGVLAVTLRRMRRHRWKERSPVKAVDST